MKPQLTTLLCLAFAFFAGAQDKIDTDRPDQTESVVTVPKKYFQGEFGFGREDYHHRDFSLSYPTFLLKYGLTHRIELRLESDFSTEHFRLVPSDKTVTALSPLEVGTKVALIEEKGLRPKTSLIFHLGIPATGTTEHQGQHLFPSFRFTFQNSLSDNIALGYNLGAAWDGYASKPAWLYTLAPGFTLGPRWYGYLEAFGFFPPGEAAQHNLDAGLAYYVSNDTRVDVSAGIGLGDENPLRNYFALGFSFRVLTAKAAKH